MTFRLHQADYHNHGKRAYVEFRRSDSDGGDRLVVAVVTFRTKKRTAISHDVADDMSNPAKELREMGRLNARAAIAQSIASISAILLWLTGASVFSG